MKPFLLLACLILAGCASQPSAVMAPSGPGPDLSPISPQVIAKAAKAPDVLALPEAYRLMLLDGQLVLVRDHDPSVPIRIESVPTETPVHPELLPQEMAAEVERNRASGARMDGALKAVMDRSHDLEQQAQVLGEQSRRLADMLAEAEAKMRALEPAKPVPDKPAQ